MNVFGGGVAMYNDSMELLGALGVSGDSSCADHNIAWRTRDILDLDTVPAGVSTTGDDNMIVDPTEGFGHPECAAAATAITEMLPVTNPID